MISDYRKKGDGTLARASDLQKAQAEYAWRVAQIKGACAVLTSISRTISAQHDFTGAIETELLYANRHHYEVTKRAILDRRAIAEATEKVFKPSPLLPRTQSG